MKTVAVIVSMMLCSIALAASPVTISDEEFLQEMKSVVAQAKTQNNAVELLGWGTATLLDSGRESKIKLGRGKPKPKPGECSDAYPIYPPSKTLVEVIAQEKAKKVEVKSTKTVWVAWFDLNGFNLAFNSGKLGDYELSTITEVEDNGKWLASRKFYLSVMFGQISWQNGPRIHGAGFTWLKLGDFTDLLERLQNLKDIGVIGYTIVDPSAEVYYLPRCKTKPLSYG